MPFESKPQQAIVVRSPNWLGDAIMTMPAVAALHSSGFSVSVFTPAKLAPIWKCLPFLDRVISGSRDLRLAARNLKQGRFDSILIFPNSLRTGLEAWLAGIPVRAGFSGHFRRFLLTHAFPRPGREGEIVHQTEDYLELAAHFHSSIVDAPATLPPATLPERPQDTVRPYLAVCPGAEYGPAKRWHVERFVETARALVKDNGWNCVVLGAAGDAATAARFCELADFPSTNLTGKTNMEQFIGWIAHASFVLCNDSGSMHLAALFNKPAVAVFGSTEPKLTGPLSPTVRVVRKHAPCSPCFLRSCPIDFRCMESITAEHVIAEARACLHKVP